MGGVRESGSDGTLPLVSRFRIDPTLSETLVNQDLISALLRFLFAWIIRSSIVGSLRKASRLAVSFIDHISLAASKRGVIMLSTVCFHLFDRGQGL